MNISLSGKRVLITGAGRGLGRGLALRVAACVGHVIALSRTQAHLDTLKAECPSVETVTCDLGNWEATRATVESLGPVHCLVNNAGILRPKNLLDVTPEDIDAVFNINVKAVINVCQVVARDMIARGERGTILNVSSQTAIRPIVTDIGVYGASKSALGHLSRTLARELGPHGIRVNCVNPTVFKSDMTHFVCKEPGRVDEILNKQPLALGRLCEIDDVVDAILFLLSERAAYISGVSLLLDGGFADCAS